MVFKCLVVDDNRNQLGQVEALLKALNHDVTTASSYREFEEKRVDWPNYDLAFIDFDLGDRFHNGYSVGKELRKYNEYVALVMITGELKGADAGSETVRNHDFLWHFEKPINIDKVNKVLAMPEVLRNSYLRSQRGIIGNHRSLLEIQKMAILAGSSNAAVLIQGETGTGKELVAKLIHANSPRHENIFFPVNCPAINEGLLESELFGHKKGSFTGALQDRLGHFRYANGGTIFLDEITEMSQACQAKILRLLQEGEVLPVGDSRKYKVDVRIIAATNKNISECIKNGNFREDLYYRLNVLPIKIPSLRERREDIRSLVDHYVKLYAAAYRKRETVSVSTEAMNCLEKYHWPGNVRDLMNAVERAVLILKGGMINLEHLPVECTRSGSIDEKRPILASVGQLSSTATIVDTVKLKDAKALLISLPANPRSPSELLNEAGQNDNEEVVRLAVLYFLKLHNTLAKKNPENTDSVAGCNGANKSPMNQKCLEYFGVEWPGLRAFIRDRTRWKNTKMAIQEAHKIFREVASE